MRTLNRISFVSVVLLLEFIFIFFYQTSLDITSEEKGVSPMGVDFAIFYSAGQIALTGDPTDMYDIAYHHEYLEKVLEREVPFLLGWFYPPTFLLFLIPFSILPYRLALGLWLAITLALALYAIFLLVPKYKKTALLACGFPGIMMNLRWGQNGFLSTALIGFGLYFLENNPVVAGLMFGLLTYKPQMAIFPLLLLLLSKKWRTLFWTGVFSLLFILMSCIAFGFDPWIKYAVSFFESSSMIQLDWVNISNVQPSLYSLLRLFGVNASFMNVLLGIVGLGTVIAICWIWRKTDNFALKGTSMAVGIFLTVPYYLQYDLVVLSIPLVLLSFDCFINGFKWHEIVILCILFSMPAVNLPIVNYTSIQICPIVLILILIMTILRTRRGVVIQNHISSKTV